MTSNVTAHCFSMRAVVLGFSLFLVSVTSAPIAAQDEDPIVAKVGQHAIYRSDVFASIESFPLAEQLNMRKRLDLTVRSLINEELLFQLILSGDSEWDRRLRNEVRGLVVSRVIERYVTEQIEVDDAEIRAYYQEHRDTLRGWHVRARHIRLRHECEDMLAKIDSEETFIEMAKVYSLDNLTAANGGDLGYMMYSEHRRDSLGFESEFFEMGLGEMRIFETENACHLIRVVEIDDPPDPPFETIREFLKPRLEQLEERELLQVLIEKASRRIAVEVNPSFR